MALVALDVLDLAFVEVDLDRPGKTRVALLKLLYKGYECHRHTLN